MTESKNKIGIRVADARSRLSAVFAEMFQCSKDGETEWKDLGTDTDVMTHLMNRLGFASYCNGCDTVPKKN